jgi:hypothetical protein
MVASQGKPSDGNMAVENGQAGQPATSSSSEEAWDEQRLEEAMATLKEMHIQVSYPLRLAANRG